LAEYRRLLLFVNSQVTFITGAQMHRQVSTAAPSVLLLLLLLLSLHPGTDAEVSVAAIGICFGLHVIIFMAIDGLAIAVSVRVANELGEVPAALLLLCGQLCKCTQGN
jgi:Na+-driven multidrug efflux pump